jgi:hypothetical protein
MTIADETYRERARQLHDEIGATHVTDQVAEWFAQTAAAEPCAVCAVIERRLREIVRESRAKRTA